MQISKLIYEEINLLQTILAKAKQIYRDAIQRKESAEIRKMEASFK